jgi:hypothetical protein
MSDDSQTGDDSKTDNDPGISEKFLINEERLETIANSFNVDLSSVQTLHREFTFIEDEIKLQRLAHITRVLEADMKRRANNPNFFIEYIPYKVRTPNMRGSMSNRRWPNKFTIYYDNTLPEKTIRVNISHELGHLYLAARYKTTSDATRTDHLNTDTTEPLSTIFGIFVVSNKNHFYDNLDVFAHRHADWDSILNDFINLNR